VDFLRTSIESWWQTASWWDALKFWVPTLMSALALGYVIYDRQPRLVLKSRKGEWCTLRKGYTGYVFEGVVEVYNRGSRANAIREYHFARKDPDEGWITLESEYYALEVDGGIKEKANITPLVLAPYSGTELYVKAMTNLMQQPYEMTVKIIVEDIFEKRYHIDVVAKS